MVVVMVGFYQFWHVTDMHKLDVETEVSTLVPACLRKLY